MENLELELANDVTTMFLNANGVAGNVTPQMVNFLEYVKTQVPNDAYTRELEAEVARLKQDKEVRRKYMVLQAELRDTEIIAFEAGEAQGHAVGLAEGMAAGEAQGELKERLKNIKAVMEKMEVNAYEAMNILEIPLEEQQKLLTLL